MDNNKLKISKDISLPLDAVTQTFGVLAKKGRGKSYTASVIAEEMLKAQQQIIAIDPTGSWWGIQSSADGKSEGYPVVVFGGDHGNIPLEEHAGEVIATSIIEQGFSAIIDLSIFRKGQANRFVGAFLETLYRLNRNPLHLFIDEADAFAPQKVFGDEARTLGAMEDIVRRGRKRGIGCTMITQRPAVINKNVLTQCEILIALGMSHPKDINAVMEWVNVHADKGQANKMIQSLPTLPIGTAWLWSPGWGDFFNKIAIRPRETFDSGATPKPGQIIKSPKKMAAIDITKLGTAIQETVERKKAEDPRELKKKIAELEYQLKNVKPQKLAPEIKHVPVLKQEEFKQLEKCFAQFNKLSIEVIQSMQLINNHKNIVLSSFDSLKSNPSVKNSSSAKPNTTTTSIATNGTIGKCERAVLIVLAERNNKNSNKNQLGILSGYSPSSGGFNNAISRLRQLNYLTGSGDQLRITQEGITAVGHDYNPLPTGKYLHQYWINKLPKCESTILDYLIQRHPNGHTKEDVGIATNYSHTSGGFNNAISRLRTLELIEGYGNIKASDSLFE